MCTCIPCSYAHSLSARMNYKPQEYLSALQVSSGSGYVSRFVHLHVYQPVATITSGTEYHVQQGTTIQLVCVVEGVSNRQAIMHG